jgi:hypothetical protein
MRPANPALSYAQSLITVRSAEPDAWRTFDVVLAEEPPAESYRDDGNRWLFQNANAGWHRSPQAPYAPVLTGGPVVDAVWERLLDRAGRNDLPPLTDEVDLQLIVDGKRVDGRGQIGVARIFRLPCHPKSVVIGSRAGAPAELGFARDPRCLGAARRRVTIRQGAKFMLVDADDERLTAGFHDLSRRRLSAGPMATRNCRSRGLPGSTKAPRSWSIWAVRRDIRRGPWQHFGGRIGGRCQRQEPVGTIRQPDQMDGAVASIAGGGACDQVSVRRAVIDRDPDATITPVAW